MCCSFFFFSSSGLRKWSRTLLEVLEVSARGLSSSGGVVAVVVAVVVVGLAAARDRDRGRGCSDVAVAV